MDLNEGGETMSEYISRNEAMQAVFDVDCHSDEHIRIRNEAMTAIECIPAADVAPIVRARWAFVPYDEEMPTFGYHLCSNCGKSPLFDANEREALSDYCPHCPAVMDLKEADHA
jgi:hypothetical protein